MLSSGPLLSFFGLAQTTSCCSPCVCSVFDGLFNPTDELNASFSLSSYSSADEPCFRNYGSRIPWNTKAFSRLRGFYSNSSLFSEHRTYMPLGTEWLFSVLPCLGFFRYPFGRYPGGQRSAYSSNWVCRDVDVLLPTAVVIRLCAICFFRSLRVDSLDTLNEKEHGECLHTFKRLSSIF